MKAEYLGDGAYVEPLDTDYVARVYTSNGVEERDSVYLDHSAAVALRDWLTNYLKEFL
jgi:hypothetical protein